MVKGYKVFNPNWTCRGKQYTCPGIFEEDDIAICEHGMHFCESAIDCFDYYGFTPINKIAEVIAHGNVIKQYNKCCTDKLEIVREISWEELLQIVNTAKDCYGLGNTDCGNFGNFNSGRYNLGNGNTGDYNYGKENSGRENIGRWNSGYCNIGDGNSGDWNNTNYSNGCFNTIEPKIYFFNKPSEMTLSDWRQSSARRILFYLTNNLTNKFIEYNNMTYYEKNIHPEAKFTGGYLSIWNSDNNKSDYAQSRWNALSDRDKQEIKGIPNFDKSIFKQITGIDVDAG